jgi:hypothetical protein
MTQQEWLIDEAIAPDSKSIGQQTNCGYKK